MFKGLSQGNNRYKFHLSWSRVSKLRPAGQMWSVNRGIVEGAQGDLNYERFCMELKPLHRASFGLDTLITTHLPRDIK